MVVLPGPATDAGTKERTHKGCPYGWARTRELDYLEPILVCTCFPCSHDLEKMGEVLDGNRLTPFCYAL